MIPFRFSPTTSKIVCFARTFAKHAVELGNQIPKEPIFFLKAPSAYIGDGELIRLPKQSHEIHHEAELAVVIGSRLSDATADEAQAAIGLWVLLNDVTARDIQRAEGGRFSKAKGFDTFCPISDVGVDTVNWQSARIQCHVNGLIRQDSGLDALLFEPAALVSYASQFMTLYPGDIVSLGTPEGVGPLEDGDLVSVQLLDKAGRCLLSLQNPVHRIKS
jgi:2-keto-4-pentenoate hydratase/2-oxohepta-3-ene-1,7-dioic acid hydratase in catechol pathway